MFKRLIPDFPLDKSSYLIIGADYLSSIYNRLKNTVSDEVVIDCSVLIPSEGEWDCVLIINEIIDVTKFDKFKVQSIYFLSEDEAEGFTPSQVELIQSDWQSLRNIEREFLKMHEAGFWTLPDDVCQLMVDREACRDKVDEEINPPEATE